MQEMNFQLENDKDEMTGKLSGTVSLFDHKNHVLQ